MAATIIALAAACGGDESGSGAVLGESTSDYCSLFRDFQRSESARNPLEERQADAERAAAAAPRQLVEAWTVFLDRYAAEDAGSPSDQLGDAAATLLIYANENCSDPSDAASADPGTQPPADATETSYECAPNVPDDNSRAEPLTISSGEYEDNLDACNAAHELVLAVFAAHDPWSTPVVPEVDGFRCTFSEIVAEDAGRAGQYVCTRGDTTVQWVLRAGE